MRGADLTIRSRIEAEAFRVAGLKIVDVRLLECWIAAYLGAKRLVGNREALMDTTP